jgi:hypothetical protein
VNEVAGAVSEGFDEVLVALGHEGGEEVVARGEVAYLADLRELLMPAWRTIARLSPLLHPAKVRDMCPRDVRMLAIATRIKRLELSVRRHRNPTT